MNNSILKHLSACFETASFYVDCLYSLCPRPCAITTAWVYQLNCWLVIILFIVSVFSCYCYSRPMLCISCKTTWSLCSSALFPFTDSHRAMTQDWIHTHRHEPERSDTAWIKRGSARHWCSHELRNVMNQVYPFREQKQTRCDATGLCDEQIGLCDAINLAGPD